MIVIHTIKFIIYTCISFQSFYSKKLPRYNDKKVSLIVFIVGKIKIKFYI